MNFVSNFSGGECESDSEDGSDVGSPRPTEKQSEAVKAATSESTPLNEPLNKAALSLAISNAIFAAAENAQKAPPVSTVRITMSYHGSLNDLANDPNPVLKCSAPNLASRLGTEVAASSITFHSYKNSFPVTIGVSAPHFKGEKLCDHWTDVGPVMAELVDKSQGVFPNGLTVYRSNNATFKREFEKNFPGISEEAIGKGISPLISSPMYTNHVLIGENTVEMHAVTLEIAKQTAEALAAGKEAGVVEPVRTDAGMIVFKPLAVLAVNVLKKTMQECDDRIPLNQFNFKMCRTRVSAAALDTARSSQTNTWHDPRELRASLKSGQQLQGELDRKCDVSIVMDVTLVHKE